MQLSPLSKYKKKIWKALLLLLFSYVIVVGRLYNNNTIVVFAANKYTVADY